jgi:hypothetical protein
MQYSSLADENSRWPGRGAECAPARRGSEMVCPAEKHYYTRARNVQAAEMAMGAAAGA